MENESSKPVGVDDVHRGVDALMLGVFEAVLGHEAVTAEPTADARAAATAAKCREIMEKYTAVHMAVNNLAGIDKTEDQQEEEILQLSQQCQAARRRILDRVDELKQRRDSIDASIMALLSDEKLGLTPPSQLRRE